MTDPRPIGPEVDSRPAQRPERVTLEGQYVLLRPVDPVRDADDLWPAIGGEEHTPYWLYMGDGPFPDRQSFDAHLLRKQVSEDPFFFVIVDRASSRAVGHAALMRIDRAHRVIEVGNIMYAQALRGSRGATEAMYLLAKYAFEDLGYRRYEWKCNAFNEPSRKAALRLGFAFEGIFRQHMIIKGRNRDTAWFSMTDAEWPTRRREFERWLAPANFDEDGVQRTRLSHS